MNELNHNKLYSDFVNIFLQITQPKAVKRKVGTKKKNPKKKRTDGIPEPKPTNLQKAQTTEYDILRCLCRQNTFYPQPIIVVNQSSYFEEDFSAWNVDEYIGQYIDNDILSLIVEKINQTFLLR